MSAAQLQCGVCGAKRQRESCHVIQLTADERAYLKSTGQTPQNEYVYCKPCWKILSNPVTGPTLMKGLVQIKLRQLGVDGSEEIANKFHAQLIQKIQPKRS